MTTKASIEELAERTTTQASESIQKGNFRFAEQLLRQLQKIMTGYPQADHLLALALHKQNKNKEAKEILKELIVDHANQWEYWNTLGVVCSTMDERSEAYVSFIQALSLNPESVVVRSNIALEHQAAGRYQDAKKELVKAMKIPSKYGPMLKFNFGNVLLDELKPIKAATYFEEVKNLLPQFTPACWNRASALLMAKEYKDGWAEYESRWEQFPNFAKVRKSMANWPLWKGENLEGKTLYLYAEQGAGDAIQFIRFAKKVRELGCSHLLMEWNSSLDRGDLTTILMNTGFVDDVVDPSLDYYPISGCIDGYKIDYHQSVSSLPHILGLYQEEDMACEPYVNPSTEFSPELDNQIWRPYEGKFKIGIVWAGSPMHHNDHKRSCCVTQFWPFCRLGKDYQVFSLQKDYRQRLWAGKEVDLAHGLAEMPIVDLRGLITDYNSTANLISKMDLIVTVDTSIAHIAGGMGKPTYLMLPLVPDWRWGVDSSHTIWYKSIRIFRQKNKGRWHQPFEKAAACVPILR